MYNPLPNCLTIKQSQIEGLGLFATENIAANTDLGISHIKDNRFIHEHIRTPLGGFVNYSDNPNCEFINDLDLIKLKTIKNIKAGEELVAIYTLYNLFE